MKRAGLISVLLIAYILLSGCSDQLPREIRNIDLNWKFMLNDTDSAFLEDFNDQQWRMLDLPHDWSIEGKYSQEHGTDWQSGFLPAGIGWYRKSIQWESGWENKKVFIRFDGIYLNSQVWINGDLLGFRPNGYISFQYDLTPYLKKGENTIAVKVDHSKPNSGRWYTGSGIYRHVWLDIHNKTYIPQNEVYFKTINISDDQARYEVETYVKNENSRRDSFTLKTRLLSSEGNEIDIIETDFSVEANERKKLIQQGSVKNPALWSPASPEYYYLESRLVQKNKTVDNPT